MHNENTCVCCGSPIPEGRQVCPECEDKAMRDTRRECPWTISGCCLC